MADRSSFIVIERCVNGFLLDMGDHKQVIEGTDTPAQDRLLESLSAWLRRAEPASAAPAAGAQSLPAPVLEALGCIPEPPAPGIAGHSD
jgi:hypothetical protein